MVKKKHQTKNTQQQSFQTKQRKKQQQNLLTEVPNIQLNDGKKQKKNVLNSAIFMRILKYTSEEKKLPVDLELRAEKA